MTAKLRIVLMADDSIVAEAEDAALWRRLLGQFTQPKTAAERVLIQRWRNTSISPGDQQLAELILAEVARSRQLTALTLLGRKRNAPIAAARHLAIYMMRVVGGLTVRVIGVVMGRDHSTIMASCDIVKKHLHDEELKAEIDRIAAVARVH